MGSQWCQSVGTSAPATPPQSQSRENCFLAGWQGQGRQGTPLVAPAQQGREITSLGRCFNSTTCLVPFRTLMAEISPGLGQGHGHGLCTWSRVPGARGRGQDLGGVSKAR